MPVKDAVYPKDLNLEKPEFAILISGNTITIRCNVAAKYIYLSTNDAGLQFSDNYFDLEPGKTKIITTNRAINKTELKVKSLYSVLNAQ